MSQNRSLVGEIWIDGLNKVSRTVLADQNLLGSVGLREKTEENMLGSTLSRALKRTTTRYTVHKGTLVAIHCFMDTSKCMDRNHAIG